MIRDFRPQELEELLNPPSRSESRRVFYASVVWVSVITLLTIVGFYL